MDVPRQVRGNGLVGYRAFPSGPVRLIQMTTGVTIAEPRLREPEWRPFQ